MQTVSDAARVRAGLGHPVVDGDGHMLEHLAVLEGFVRDHGRGDLVDRASMFTRPVPSAHYLAVPADERRRAGWVAMSYWLPPGDADYFATVSIPARYHERLAEAGIDFSVLYPTKGLVLSSEKDEECRVEMCRLYNDYLIEEYRPYRDRLTPAAVIPMHTPAEAVAELDHAAAVGLKVGLIPTYVWRDRQIPGGPTRSLRFIDTYGIDSEHDYDPVWAKAIELGFPLACHSVGMGFTDRSSPSNYMYNHIGHFAAAGETLAKSLFFAGVTRRFPALRVALLEGGAAVGVRLYGDLVARFEKRGPQVIGRLNPANVDLKKLARIMTHYGGRLGDAAPARLVRDYGVPEESVRDDFALSGVNSVEDIRDAFCRNFYWGCEADDPLVGLAFDSRVNPLGARVPAIMGSDIGHWDVPEFNQPLMEASELVEQGILNTEQFRAFVFENPVRMYGSLNPNFFEDTVIEEEAASVTTA